MALWDKFAHVWKFDTTELPEAARREFFRLSDEERGKAVVTAPKYLADCAKRGKRAYHASKWLSGKGFSAFEPSIGASIVAKAVGAREKPGGGWMIYQGGPQAAAWCAYLAAVGGKPLKFVVAGSGAGFCSRPSEWPPPARREEAG